MLKKLLNKFLNKNHPTLLQDIYTHSDWIIKALNSSGYAVDYSVDSMKEIDRFIDEQNLPGGLIERNRGQIIFALGAFIGQTTIKLYGGEWITDDNDPRGELEIAVKLPNGFLMWPVQKCIKRIQLGQEESIYSYVRAINTLDK
jgi:hypothetical protein